MTECQSKAYKAVFDLIKSGERRIRLNAPAGAGGHDVLQAVMQSPDIHQLPTGAEIRPSSVSFVAPTMFLGRVFLKNFDCPLMSINLTTPHRLVRSKADFGVGDRDLIVTHQCRMDSIDRILGGYREAGIDLSDTLILAHTIDHFTSSNASIRVTKFATDDNSILWW